MDLVTLIAVLVACSFLHPGTPQETQQNEDVLNSDDLVNTIHNGSVKSRTLFDYQTRVVAYKDLVESRCLLSFLRNGESLIGQKQRENLPSNFLLSENKLTKRQIYNLGGQRITEFCRGFPTHLIQNHKTFNPDDNLPDDDSEDGNNKIVKRETKHYFSGRMRGQTQSQYLNVGNNGQPGTAEAESTYGGSKAVVSGSSGMGQAQSQSSPYGCDECYGGETGTGTVGGGDVFSPGAGGIQRPGGDYGRPELIKKPPPVGPLPTLSGPPSSPSYPGQISPTYPGKPGFPGPQFPGYPGQPSYPITPGYPKQPGPTFPGQGPQYPPSPGYPGQRTAQPSGPSIPIPGYPGQPQLPTHPAGPGISISKYPGQPGQIQLPTQPSGPGVSILGYPGHPSRPQIPSVPSISGYPEQNGRPQLPTQPSGPGVTIPGYPGHPSQHQIPGYPGAPLPPSQPSGPYPIPGESGYPGQIPRQPGYLKPPSSISPYPVYPGQPTYPSQPSRPSDLVPGYPTAPGTPSGPIYSITQGYPQQPGVASYPGHPRPSGPSENLVYPGTPPQGSTSTSGISDGSGKFGGQLTGGYESQTGNRGRFSGVFSGEYQSTHGGGTVSGGGGGDRFVVGPGGRITYPGQPGYPSGDGGVPSGGPVYVVGPNGEIITSGQPGYPAGPSIVANYPGETGGLPTYPTRPVGGEEGPGNILGPGGGVTTYHSGPGSGFPTGSGGGGLYPLGPDGTTYPTGPGRAPTYPLGPGGESTYPGSPGGFPGYPTGGGVMYPGISGGGTTYPTGPTYPGGGGTYPGSVEGATYPGSSGGVTYPGGPGSAVYPGRPGASGSLPGSPGTVLGPDGRPVVPGQSGYPGEPSRIVEQPPGGNGEGVGGGSGGHYDQYGNWIASATPDDSDSQAETSVQQSNNETQAVASAQGKHSGGTAQSQVTGTYSGSGSFSASAGSDDGKRGAQTQVSGGKEGASSSAQGRGGIGQSQAQVQLASETGDTVSTAQTGGWNHGSQTQVQASGKGGMADAQSNGPGSTSSQAQIGFTPYDEGEEKDDQSTAFRGGGQASAQSGTHTGQAQSQIQGKFLYGIRYTGAAQAGSGGADARNQTRPYGLPGTFPTLKPVTYTSGNGASRSSHHSSPSGPLENSQPRSIGRSPEPDPTKQLPEPGAHEVPSSSHQDPDATDDYDEDEYNDYPDNESTEKVSGGNKPSSNTHLPVVMSQPQAPKSTIIAQNTKSQSQHVVLGPLEDLDATVHQSSGDNFPLPKDGTILQPGQRIPGSQGYQIPAGFRGRVKSISNGPNTYSIGRNSQAQSVTLSPGTGRVVYRRPVYAIGSNTQTHNGQYGFGSGYAYQPIQYRVKSGKALPDFVSVTKSETGSRNLYTGKKTPSVYYTQSSSCGVFTNSCVFNASGKICFPKAKTNPDGSLMSC